MTQAVFNRPVYVVDGTRTPFLKARGVGVFSAADMAVQAGRQLINRQPFPIQALDEVILGCVMPSPREVNIARVVALRLGCDQRTPAWTVQRNCASGMQALDSAAHHIACGRTNLALAGGVDVMSRAPVLLNDTMVKWMVALNRAKGFDKARVIAQLRAKHFKPVISLLLGLTDPVVNLDMGQTAEEIAHRFNISRLDMDSFSLESHKRLAQAQDNQQLTEITPLFDAQGQYYEHDDGVRRDSDMSRLSSRKPYFDRPVGKVTAANSSQITDGAACLLLASESAIEQYQLPILGQIIDAQWAGLDPSQMGLGPVHAITPILQRHHFELNDIDYWEINEAFAAQVLACIAAWQDENYCQQNLNLTQAMGKIDPHKLNIDGGAIALGHPVGASGARIVLHLLHVLKRQQAKRGIASLCIGGGQGGAMLLEVD